MQEFTEITGMVIKAEPIGEYDRRVVILTKEKGKIAAFARGARKPTSRILAATTPFSFGKFRIYEGRSSYTLTEADISNYFEGLRSDFESACYGMYFLEVMDYYTRENNDDKEMLKLLYQSLRALMHEKLPNRLVRYIFEMKAMALNGEFPGMPKKGTYEGSTNYAVHYIMTSPVEKLYTFTVTDTVLAQLAQIADDYRKRYLDRTFKSLEVLDTLF
ncbi:MAG: DNA repair protein RecO [Blautia sp.]|nr:DNA repair protein RecO [Blautia sp.]MCM1200403.1 DNA repair protein RecO [Bacteroides fragilis]